MSRLSSALLAGPCAASLLVCAAAVLAPLLMPAHTRLCQAGSPGRFDQGHAGSPALARAIYLLGDYSCHQDPARSFFINGNQMPFCMREVCIYAAFSAVLLVLVIRRGAARREGARVPVMRALALGLVAVLPMLLDALILPAFTAWRPVAGTRIATGLAAGGGLALTWSWLLEGRGRRRRGATQELQYGR